MTTTAENWLKASSGRERTLAEERLILEVTEQIWEILEKGNLSRSDLARELGTSRANVTQVLNGNRNMTLRTLASIAYVLDTNVHIQLGDSDAYGSWHDIADALMVGKSKASDRNVHTDERSLTHPVDAANTDWIDVCSGQIA